MTDEQKIKSWIKHGVAIWGFFILIGMILSILKGLHTENFGMLFVSLTALHPYPMIAEESNKLFFYSWAFVQAVILFILAFLGWKKKSLKLALIFLILSVILFPLGIIRILLSINIA